jgi:hypothetical protein
MRTPDTTDEDEDRICCDLPAAPPSSFWIVCDETPWKAQDEMGLIRVYNGCILLRTRGMFEA